MSKAFAKTDDGGTGGTGRELYDPRFGERYIILKSAEETDGEMVRVEDTAAPGPSRRPASSHPYQEERFEVVSGILRLKVDGEEHLLGPGERFVVPPGARHLPRNAGEEELRFVAEMRPAGRFEEFLTEITAANNSGREGLAYLLTAVRVLQRYPDVEHPTPLPRPVERALFAILAAAGGLLDRWLLGSEPTSLESSTMAKEGDVLENPLTGQRLIFRKTARDTGGELLEVESVYTIPTRARPSVHYHPYQEERFEVLSGEVHARIDDEERLYGVGDFFAILPGTPHTMWAEQSGVHVNWQTRPALKTEAFFEMAWGLARAGKVDEKGTPNLLQAAVMGREYEDEYRLARPPWPLQKAFLAVLAPIGGLPGYEAKARGDAPVSKTTPSRPSGVVRLAFKLPIYLYRYRLGWLLGHRFLLLTHRGRKSGRRRQTPLEVVRYDPATDESIVVSGWGEKSDWYRNLKANPALEIQTGRERYVPEQRFLTPEEVYAEIAAYERHHPWLVRTISRWLGYPLDGTERARRSFADSLRMVAFRPESGSS